VESIATRELSGISSVPKEHLNFPPFPTDAVCFASTVFTVRHLRVEQDGSPMPVEA
jgi:hypothetical protein